MRPAWPYIIRQGMANLYRPNNQTAILLMALGMGVFLISTLYLTQNILLSQVNLSGSEKNPNMVLFDIQSDQLEGVKQKLTQMDLELKQEIPIVTMRISSINDIPVDKLKKDTTDRYEHWALNHELRSTYRNYLTESEKIVKGTFKSSTNDSILISIANGYEEALGLKVGDKIVFNVQGIPLTTWVGSVREVSFNRVEPNFLVVFPPDALQGAPQFHVIVTHVNNSEQSALFQRSIVQDFPGVSLIDLGLIIRTLQSVLDEISFVIRFMAFFTIFTGVIVMITSLSVSKFQRIRETVLLRTIGAEKKVVQQIFSVEYFFLGLLSALIGIFLSFIFSWVLAFFIFDTAFIVPGAGIVVIFLLMTALTLILGTLGNKRLFNYPPLEVLRAEV
jgi:putative ABC transport system permease protein